MLCVCLFVVIWWHLLQLLSTDMLPIPFLCVAVVVEPGKIPEINEMYLPADTIPVCWFRLWCHPVTYSLLWPLSVLLRLCPRSRPVLRLGPSHCHLCQHH